MKLGKLNKIILLVIVTLSLGIGFYSHYDFIPSHVAQEFSVAKDGLNNFKLKQ